MMFAEPLALEHGTVDAALVYATQEQKALTVPRLTPSSSYATQQSYAAPRPRPRPRRRLSFAEAAPEETQAGVGGMKGFFFPIGLGMIGALAYIIWDETRGTGARLRMR